MPDTSVGLSSSARTNIGWMQGQAMDSVIHILWPCNTDYPRYDIWRIGVLADIYVCRFTYDPIRRT